MTANPKWPEVTNALLPGQTAQDRPDLVSRMFHLKKKHLLDMITKDKIFGEVMAHVHCVGFSIIAKTL